MTSIKEIAKIAEVSVGTASFVLNGKGDQMRISKMTQERVLKIAKELGYTPNISARRLRSSDEKVLPVIAMLWTKNARSTLIKRFLDGIQDKSSSREQNREFELLIQPYENGHLNKISSLKTGTRFNGAIIVGATEADMDYLETNDVNVPIVFYQRKSNKFSTVYADSFRAGENVADVFMKKGHRKVGLMVPRLSNQAVTLRKEGFVSRVTEHSLELSSDNILIGSFSEEGGYQSVKEWLTTKKELPTAIFSLCDEMAVGALSAFHEEGIGIPEDIEMISHDDYEITKFTIPALSTVHLPVEEMAAQCMRTLLDLIEKRAKAPIHSTFESPIVFRKSCEAPS
ncbi:LacI family DNA-binding transcriptional regulator [Bacillus sp. USDA818B3_A]|uniref:LacI family DNA-binding transcriptional regulator n=1 Tax=Bacillus sp. USDA818B3_A TaxID=2698834 RepID=UPI00136D72E1|nr:LacI family DNA-binding transcriptional regulator [Bacillus sp. USDA818B3_A]